MKNKTIKSKKPNETGNRKSLFNSKMFQIKSDIIENLSNDHTPSKEIKKNDLKHVDDNSLKNMPLKNSQFLNEIEKSKNSKQKNTTKYNNDSNTSNMDSIIYDESEKNSKNYKERIKMIENQIRLKYLNNKKEIDKKYKEKNHKDKTFLIKTDDYYNNFISENIKIKNNKLKSNRNEYNLIDDKTSDFKINKKYKTLNREKENVLDDYLTKSENLTEKKNDYMKNKADFKHEDANRKNLIDIYNKKIYEIANDFLVKSPDKNFYTYNINSQSKMNFMQKSNDVCANSVKNYRNIIKNKEIYQKINQTRSDENRKIYAVKYNQNSKDPRSKGNKNSNFINEFENIEIYPERFSANLNDDLQIINLLINKREIDIREELKEEKIDEKYSENINQEYDSGRISSDFLNFKKIDVKNVKKTKIEKDIRNSDENYRFEQINEKRKKSVFSQINDLINNKEMNKTDINFFSKYTHLNNIQNILHETYKPSQNNQIEKNSNGFREKTEIYKYNLNSRKLRLETEKDFKRNYFTSKTLNNYIPESDIDDITECIVNFRDDLKTSFLEEDLHRLYPPNIDNGSIEKNKDFDNKMDQVRNMLDCFVEENDILEYESHNLMNIKDFKEMSDFSDNDNYIKENADCLIDVYEDLRNDQRIRREKEAKKEYKNIRIHSNYIQNGKEIEYGLMQDKIINNEYVKIEKNGNFVPSVMEIENNGNRLEKNIAKKMEIVPLNEINIEIISSNKYSNNIYEVGKSKIINNLDFCRVSNLEIIKNNDSIQRPQKSDRKENLKSKNKISYSSLDLNKRIFPKEIIQLDTSNCFVEKSINIDKEKLSNINFSSLKKTLNFNLSNNESIEILSENKIQYESQKINQEKINNQLDYQSLGSKFNDNNGKKSEKYITNQSVDLENLLIKDVAAKAFSERKNKDHLRNFEFYNSQIKDSNYKELDNLMETISKEEKIYNICEITQFEKENSQSTQIQGNNRYEETPKKISKNFKKISNRKKKQRKSPNFKSTKKVSRGRRR